LDKVNNWNDDRRPDYYIDKSPNLAIVYENSLSAKLDKRFDEFVKKVGGKGRTILLLFVMFTVIISAVSYLFYISQQRRQFNFNGNTLGLVSIDREIDRKMILEDQYGNILTFTSWANRFTISYLGNTFSVIGSFDHHSFTFSDGSRGNNSRNQDPRVFRSNAGYFPVGRVPHFTAMQQAESIILALLIDFYEGYMETHIFVLIVLASLVLWLFCLIGSFFREGIHKTFRPFKRVLHAEREDERLAVLAGKVSVTSLALKFVIMVIFAVVLIHLL